VASSTGAARGQYASMGDAIRMLWSPWAHYVRRVQGFSPTMVCIGECRRSRWSLLAPGPWLGKKGKRGEETRWNMAGLAMSMPS
jgi:hypothetical protein